MSTPFFECIMIFDIINILFNLLFVFIPMLMFSSICLNILATLVISFPVYVNDIQLLFVFCFWISRAEIIFCFFSVYTVVFLWFCCWKRCILQAFIYSSVHRYSYLLLWKGLWVGILNCWIWWVFVGGDVWTFCGWLMCCLKA